MQKTFFFAIIPLMIVAMVPAYADTIRGKDFDSVLLGHDDLGAEIRQYTSHPERIYDNGWKDYKVYENSTVITFETANSGSLVFHKATCSYDMYGNGYIAGNAQVKGISYTVKGKPNASSTWSNVNSVNNAACMATIIESTGEIKILGTKNNTVGAFQIELKYSPGLGIKETLKAFNNNPAWNNHNIGFTEKFQVPQIIKLGAAQYDLSQYNNTVLDRDWIDNNSKKIMHLTDKLDYDFGIGFNNLQDIKITWVGGKAFLSLNYLYGNYIVPYQQWIEVDPTFNSAPSGQGRIYSTDVSTNCATQTGTNADSVFKVSKQNAATGCQMVWQEWDISSIVVGSTVTSAYFEWDQNSTLNWISDCGLYSYATRPSTLSTANKWSQGWGGSGAGTTGLCTSDGNDKQLTINSTGIANIQANIAGSEGWWGAMFQSVSGVVDATGREFQLAGGGNTKLNIVYVAPGPPDAITDLHTTAINAETVDLAFSAPSMNGGTLQAYLFNYTTPCGTPLTVLPNGTTATTYTVSGLTASTCYSFRASAGTEFGRNDTGNILNVTTLTFNEANYTIGSFSYLATNQNIFPIRYERIDNGTQTLVNVTFTNTFNLACDLRYTYAQTNQTYHTISSIPVSTSEDEASFSFQNSTNDIVTFHCWNQSGNQSANYVMTQTDFLLKQQVRDFRNGTYGTMGQFGAFDFITLIVVIIAMIGLNHKSESVGGFFAIVAVAVLAYFEIIAWYTAIIAGLAVIILLAISSTRKD